MATAEPAGDIVTRMCQERSCPRPYLPLGTDQASQRRDRRRRLVDTYVHVRFRDRRCHEAVARRSTADYPDEALAVMTGCAVNGRPDPPRRVLGGSRCRRQVTRWIATLRAAIR